MDYIFCIQLCRDGVQIRSNGIDGLRSYESEFLDQISEPGVSERQWVSLFSFLYQLRNKAGWLHSFIGTIRYGYEIYESSWKFNQSSFQPGHNGFFLSPSANQIWIVYHANSVTPGTCDGNRYTLVQQCVYCTLIFAFSTDVLLRLACRVGWHSDGSPNFGSPRALTDNVPEPQ